jgi:hypothetical protein
VHRHADLARLVRDAALHGLADPPGCVRRELEALAPVELLDGADEADDALLDQVEEREPVALVALRDRDDQPQVRVDHLLLRVHVAALDALGELDLLLLGQERIAADLVHEELERVRGRGRQVAVHVGRLRLAAAVVAELDPTVLDLLVERLDLLLAETEGVDQRVDLGVLEAFVLLAAVEQC